MSRDTLQGAARESRRLRPDFAMGLQPARWGTGFQLGTDEVRPVRPQLRRQRSVTSGWSTVAIWADPERQLAGGRGEQRQARQTIPRSSGTPALMDRITLEIPRA